MLICFITLAYRISLGWRKFFSAILSTVYEGRLITILSRNEILRLIDEGRLKIEPFKKDQVGPGSIDLTLGNQFRVFKKIRGIVHIRGDVDADKYTKLTTIRNDSYLLLMPGELVHGITKELVELPDDIAGWIEGRSSYAKMRLMVHMSAGLVQPGTRNRQVLEVSNLSPAPIALYPGTKICQLVLESVQGRAKYRGRFRNQRRP
ncbi:MAG: dCTP deaminase [Thermoproteota archaeon]